MSASIYVLVDPRTGDIRYVGFTLKTLEARLGIHLRAGGSNHRVNWIKSLRRCGHAPVIRLVQMVTVDACEAAEVYWIGYFKSIGCDLVNMTNGGKSKIGYKTTEETRRKMSESATGKKWSLERRAGYSRLPHSMETRSKISRAASNPSADTRLKMRASHLGKSLDPEQKAKISAANKGRKLTHEQVAKIKAWQAVRPPISEETRIKMRMAKLGRMMPDAQKAKISAALSGRSKSDETKAKMKAARANRG
jgi:group I intron endonuclease